jgi:hypothetical protein
VVHFASICAVDQSLRLGHQRRFKRKSRTSAYAPNFGYIARIAANIAKLPELAEAAAA